MTPQVIYLFIHLFCWDRCVEWLFLWKKKIQTPGSGRSGVLSDRIIELLDI